MNAETIINKQNRNNGKIEAIITNADQEEFEVTKKKPVFDESSSSFSQNFLLSAKLYYSSNTAYSIPVL